MPAGPDLAIATRESPLAMWQARHVRDLLVARYPSSRVEIIGMTTRGDQILDRTLSRVGGKGLFVKELELALREGMAGLAVHSLKDVPMDLPSEFTLAAICAREDPRDALVSPRYAHLEELPNGARVGTASLRRTLMLRRSFPRLEVVSARGNVGTRLAKLDRGDFDALIMAGAGLKRLGLSDRIRCLLPPEDSLPAPGQGALAIEILSAREDLLETLSFLNDEETRRCVTAERAVSRALGGSCQVPLAAYCQERDGVLELRAIVGDHLTGESLAAESRGKDPEELAAAVVAQLEEQGAGDLLRRVLARDAV